MGSGLENWLSVIYHVQSSVGNYQVQQSSLVCSLDMII